MISGIDFESHLKMIGNMIFLIIQSPTLSEMETCHIIKAKNPNPWIRTYEYLPSCIFHTISISLIGANEKHSRKTPENVASKLRCFLETTNWTQNASTQCRFRHANHQLNLLSTTWSSIKDNFMTPSIGIVAFKGKIS